MVNCPRGTLHTYVKPHIVIFSFSFFPLDWIYVDSLYHSPQEAGLYTQAEVQYPLYLIID